MNSTEFHMKNTPASTNGRLSRTTRIGLGGLAIILYSVALLVAAAYVSFKAPIKPDRYGHAFSRHLGDRLAAYVLWFRSPAKTERATMSIEKISQILDTASAKHGVDRCLVLLSRSGSLD